VGLTAAEASDFTTKTLLGAGVLHREPHSKIVKLLKTHYTECYFLGTK
jgi:hypothetical protein